MLSIIGSGLLQYEYETLFAAWVTYFLNSFKLQIMASSLNGLTVGDSLPDTLMDSPARSENMFFFRWLINVFDFICIKFSLLFKDFIIHEVMYIFMLFLCRIHHTRILIISYFSNTCVPARETIWWITTYKKKKIYNFILPPHFHCPRINLHIYSIMLYKLKLQKICKSYKWTNLLLNLPHKLNVDNTMGQMK